MLKNATTPHISFLTRLTFNCLVLTFALDQVNNFDQSYKLKQCFVVITMAVVIIISNVMHMHDEIIADGTKYQHENPQGYTS